MGKFNQNINGAVENHPLQEFQDMAALDDQDNFAEEFAALMNALATNIVIPESKIDEPDEAGKTKEDVLKEFVATHAKQEVYAKMGGQLKAAKPPETTPEGGMSASDISVKGVGGGGGGSGGVVFSNTTPSDLSMSDQWVDTSYSNPALKFHDGDKLVTVAEGDNVPAEKNVYC